MHDAVAPRSSRARTAKVACASSRSPCNVPTGSSKGTCGPPTGGGGPGAGTDAGHGGTDAGPTACGQYGQVCTANGDCCAGTSDPQTVESLNKLLDRMDIIVFAVEALDGFLSRADVIADNVTDSVGDLRTLMAESGTAGLMEKLPQLARAGAQVADISATPAPKVDLRLVSAQEVIQSNGRLESFPAGKTKCWRVSKPLGFQGPTCGISTEENVSR